jgi:sn-glycerol 3-phosphate transport system permease protein
MASELPHSEVRFAISPARKRRRKIVNAIFGNPYILVAPSALLIAVFSVRSLFWVVQKSFMRYDMVEGVAKYIGLENYITIFTNPAFLQVLRNTLVFMLVAVFGGLLLGLLMGLFLNKKGRIFDTTQSIVYSPAMLSSVSTAVMWMLVMDPRSGLANAALKGLGLPTLMWMKGESTSLMSVLITSLWGGVGGTSLIVIAGLQSIPTYIYESAKLDRARGFTLLRRIIFPLISPTLFYLFITGTIGAFSTFDQINLMTLGGPNNSSNVLVHWIYMSAFKFYRIGPAMAGSVVFLFIIGLVTILNFTALAKRVHYQ